MSVFLENDLPAKLGIPIQKILKREKLIDSKVSWRRVLFSGGSNLAVSYEVDISGRTEDEDKELHLFIKQMNPSSPFKIISVSGICVTELFAYKELFEIFAELQEQANVPPAERYQTVKMYDESNEEVLIMDNIAKRGFIANHKNEVPSLNFLKSSIKGLAKLHALSFVLKETRPEYFAAKAKPLKSHFIFGEHWEQMITEIRDLGMEHVDENFKTTLGRVCEGLKTKFCDYRTDETINVCLCHSDYKSSNIMIKSEDADEDQKIIIVDYQFLYYGCPAFDFLYFIFICTDRKTRKVHLENFKDLYYETLSHFLKYFDLEAAAVYPREDFEKVYKEKLDYGLMVATMMMPFLYATGHDAPDFNGSDWNNRDDGGIKARYQDLFEEFMEWGYI